MLRPLLVIADLNPKKRGSLEQQFCALSSHLRARGLVAHFLFSARPIPQVEADLRDAGARWDTIDFTRPHRAARQVALLARRLRPALVHAHFVRITSPILFAAAAGGAQVVLNDHMILNDRRHDPRRYLKRILFGGLHRISPVSMRVAVSSSVAESVIRAEATPEERMRIIPNGLDLGRFAGIERAAARQALGLGGAPGRQLIGMIARMVHDKGVDLAIHALACLTQAGRDVELLLVGDGPLTGALQRMARELGVGERVRFLGLRDDVERVLAACDQAWAPSRVEPFGLAAAEAMASSRPVVVAAVDALPDVVGHGTGGVVVPHDNAIELAGAAQSLMDDPVRAARLGRAARARAEAEFSMTRFVERVCALYAEMVPGWRRALQ
jgi:glycosyltransferase involved in cell wall biosynthesis